MLQKIFSALVVLALTVSLISTALSDIKYCDAVIECWLGGEHPDTEAECSSDHTYQNVECKTEKQIMGDETLMQAFCEPPDVPPSGQDSEVCDIGSK